MKGTQEIKDISMTKHGEIELTLWYSYNIILTPQEAKDLIIKLQSLLDEK